MEQGMGTRVGGLEGAFLSWGSPESDLSVFTVPVLGTKTWGGSEQRHLKHEDEEWTHVLTSCFFYMLSPFCYNRSSPLISSSPASQSLIIHSVCRLPHHPHPRHRRLRRPPPGLPDHC